MNRCLLRGLVLMVTLGVGMSANATLLEFKFEGTASGSVLNLGGPDINLSNAAFTVTGSTSSDTDLSPAFGVGVFFTMNVIDFGALGSFVSDVATTAFYLQNCGALGGVAIGCAGMNDTTGGSFTVGFGSVPGDVGLDGLPVGTDIATTLLSASNPFSLTNASGDSVNLNVESIDVFSIAVPSQGSIVQPAVAVPAPGSLLLIMLGMAGLAGFARSKLA